MRQHTSLPFTQYPVGDNNYDTSRKQVSLIVIHTEDGNRNGTRATFAKTAPTLDQGRSAHYGVNLDGSLDLYVTEDYVAYHAKNYSINQISIGIEHEDNAQPNSPRPDALYNESIKLVAELCKVYSIPCDRQHIIRHSEVPAGPADAAMGYKNVPTSCPDSLEIDRIVAGALKILGQPVNNPVVITTTDRVNMRSKPNTKVPVIGVLPKGQKVTTEQWIEGESVNGNNKWWQLKGQLTYIWSGATDIIPSAATAATAATPETVFEPTQLLTDDEQNALEILQQAKAKYGFTTDVQTIQQLITIFASLQSQKKVTGPIGALTTFFGYQ